MSENDSEMPPSDSLKSIKEVAKARIQEAKEKTKARGSATGKEDTPGIQERKSSSSKLPRPFQGLDFLRMSSSKLLLTMNNFIGLESSGECCLYQNMYNSNKTDTFTGCTVKYYSIPYIPIGVAIPMYTLRKNKTTV